MTPFDFFLATLSDTFGQRGVRTTGTAVHEHYWIAFFERHKASFEKICVVCLVLPHALVAFGLKIGGKTFADFVRIDG